MADPHVIAAPMKRRAELAGQIGATHEALRKIVLELESRTAKPTGSLSPEMPVFSKREGHRSEIRPLAHERPRLTGQRRLPLRPGTKSVLFKGLDCCQLPRAEEAPMRRYGQYCPVAKAAEVFAERWTPLIVRELLAGSRHFNDIHRGVPLMSRTMLSLRLKQLSQLGVIRHKRSARSGSEYQLTPAGLEFGPLVLLLGEWGQRWFRSKFDDDDLDVGLLTWEMRRAVKPEAFPAGRVNVRFDFSDQPVQKRHWWIVSSDGEVDVCPVDPGYEVDLLVSTDVATLTRVWMGDLSAKSAMAAGKIELEGQRIFCRSFEQWLGLSCFAGVRKAHG